MTTIKNSLNRGSPLPCLTPIRTNSPLKSSLATIQPVLPDIISTTVLQKHPMKKRVRFALKLEAVDHESPSPSDPESPIPSANNSRQRTTDPWRENGPLYGAYVEYLERNTPETPETNRPSRPLPPPEPEVESSTYTHTFLIQSKSPEIIIDSITVSTPPTHHLPRLIQRPKPILKINRKQSTNVVDANFKQRMNTPIQSRHIQSRKIPNSMFRNQPSPTQPIVRRVDLALPSIKTTVPPNEKVTRPDQPGGAKVVHDHFHSKKLTEILTNPLPGANNQLNYMSGQSILPNLPKIPPVSYHNQINNEPYFFQTHTTNHIQPIIHSTR